MNCDDFQMRYDLLVDAAAGHTSLGEDETRELSDHARSCAVCAVAIRSVEQLALAMRRLPIIKMERPIDLTAIKRQSHVSPWAIPVASLAAAVLAWFSLHTEPAAPLPKIHILAAADAIVRAKDERTVILERGRATVACEPGAAIRLETPYAMVTSTGGSFAIEVNEAVTRTNNPFIEDPFMNPTLKTAAIAAGISLIVTSGTVMVSNALGQRETNALDITHVPADGAPQVLAMGEQLERVQRSLANVERDMRAYRDGMDKKAGGVEDRISALESSMASAASAPAAGAPAKEPKFPRDPAKLRDRFKKFAGEMSPMTLLQSQNYNEFADAIRDMGEEGVAMVLEFMNSKDTDEQFLAAALAEAVRDPRTIKPLEEMAGSEADFVVRRMASHALAFMNNPLAGDALVNLVKNESRDGGVSLNAWYGLARMNRPEAGDLLDKVIETSTGEIPPDMAVSTAISLRNPSLYGSLRRAYDNPRISVGSRAGILRELGSDKNNAYDDFLRTIANDPAAEERLRTAANDALK